MHNSIQVGSTVQLLSVPDWLIHDLPSEEQQSIRNFVGQYATVESIDAYGYLWIGFGSTQSNDETATYSGHSFGVPVACLSLA